MTAQASPGAEMEALAAMLGEEIGGVERELKAHYALQLAVRDSRIAALEARLAALEEAVTQP